MTFMINFDENIEETIYTHKNHIINLLKPVWVTVERRVLTKFEIDIML